MSVAHARVRTFLQEFRALHVAYVRREGHPGEMRKQADFLLNDVAESLSLAAFRTVDEPLPRAVGDFAVQTAAFGKTLKLSSAANQSVVDLFHNALTDQQVASDRRALCRIGDMAVNFTHQVEGSTFASLLPTVYDRGVESVIDVENDREMIQDVERLLRVGSTIQTKPCEFETLFGSGPVVLLPRKRKVEMTAKLMRCKHASRLVHKVRTAPSMSRLDALRLLNTLATEGLYDQELATACCDVLTNTVSASAPRDVARSINALGVLGHRHQSLPLWCQYLSADKLTATDSAMLLEGSAMLQLPLTSLKVAGVIDDCLWLHNKRAQDAWVVNALHALAVVDHKPHKFVVHSCRRLLTKIHTLDERQLLKLLFAVNRNWDPVPFQLQENWRKVSRVREILSAKVKERKFSEQLRPVASSALAVVG